MIQLDPAFVDDVGKEYKRWTAQPSPAEDRKALREIAKQARKLSWQGSDALSAAVHDGRHRWKFAKHFADAVEAHADHLGESARGHSTEKDARRVAAERLTAAACEAYVEEHGKLPSTKDRSVFLRALGRLVRDTIGVSVEMRPYVREWRRGLETPPHREGI